jgi:TP901 family phage tail tape measure protein
MARRVLEVQVIGDASSLTRALSKAGQDTDAFGNKATDAAEKQRKGGEVIHKAALVGVAAVGGLAVAAVNAAGNYEASLNKFQSISGATGAEMEKVSGLAKKLGADVKLPGTSAADAAEAMTEMKKAGVSLGDTMTGVRSVLVLSAAAEVDNAKAAEIASNALNTFKLKGKDVAMVADQLANTANASSVEITDVADATKMAGAVFSGFQGPVLGAKGAMTELNVAIGLLGNAGIKGSDAGTSLKAALLHLASPSEKSKDMMHALYAASLDAAGGQDSLRKMIGAGSKERGEMLESMEKGNKALRAGGDIAYDASGKMRSLPEILKLVTAGTKGMTQESKQAYIAQIFGADATRSVIALMQAGPKEWDKMEAAVTRKGAADEIAAAKMKGFKGSMEAFKSTLETLAITFGEMLLPAVTAGMRALSTVGGWMGENQTVVVVFTATVGGLAAIIVTVNAVTRVWTATTAAWAAITGAATGAQAAFNAVLLANPIGVVVIAIAALVAGLVIAYKESESFRNIVNSVWETIKGAAAAIGEAVTALVTFATELPGKIKGGIEAAPTALVDAGKWMLGKVLEGFKLIATGIADAATWLFNQAKSAVQFYIDSYRAVGSWILNRVVDGFKVVTELLGSVGSWVRDRIGDLIRLEIEGLKNIGTWIVNRVVDGFTTLTEALGNVGRWFKNRLVDGFELVKDGVIAIGGWILDKILAGIKDIGDKIKNAVEWIKDKIVAMAKEVFKDAIKIGVDIIPTVKNPFLGKGDPTPAMIPPGGYGGGNGLVAFGRYAQGLGYDVGEHPAFGGVSPVHSHYGAPDHYNGGALDINADDFPGGEGPALDRLRAIAQSWIAAGKLSLWGPGLLWRVEDHYDHMHLSGFANGGFARGMAVVGERGPELVDFGLRGARVHSNSESREMLSDGAGSGGDVNLHFNGPTTIGSTTGAKVLANQLAYRARFG